MMIGPAGPGSRHVLRKQPVSTPEEGWCDRLDLERALEQLPWEFRMAVHMRADGYSERDTAARLHITREELQRWLDRAYLMLRRDLGEA